MKLMSKLLAAPVVLILTVTVWICVLLVRTSAYFLGIVSALMGLLGLAVMITYSVSNGLILLVIAFLVSPVGLPTLAIRLLGMVQDAKDALRNFVA